MCSYMSIDIQFPYSVSLIAFFNSLITPVLKSSPIVTIRTLASFSALLVISAKVVSNYDPIALLALATSLEMSTLMSLCFSVLSKGTFLRTEMPECRWRITGTSAKKWLLRRGRFVTNICLNFRNFSINFLSRTSIPPLYLLMEFGVFTIKAPFLITAQEAQMLSADSRSKQKQIEPACQHFCSMFLNPYMLVEVIFCPFDNTTGKSSIIGQLDTFSYIYRYIIC